MLSGNKAGKGEREKSERRIIILVGVNWEGPTEKLMLNKDLKEKKGHSAIGEMQLR